MFFHCKEGRHSGKRENKKRKRELKKKRKEKSIPMYNSLFLISYWVNSGNNVNTAYQILRGCIRKTMTAKAIRNQTKHKDKLL